MCPVLRTGVTAAARTLANTAGRFEHPRNSIAGRSTSRNAITHCWLGSRISRPLYWPGEQPQASLPQGRSAAEANVLAGPPRASDTKLRTRDEGLGTEREGAYARCAGGDSTALRIRSAATTHFDEIRRGPRAHASSAS
jgi:hypothetical protein